MALKYYEAGLTLHEKHISASLNEISEEKKNKDDILDDDDTVTKE